MRETTNYPHLVSRRQRFQRVSFTFPGHTGFVDSSRFDRPSRRRIFYLNRHFFQTKCNTLAQWHRYTCTLFIACVCFFMCGACMVHGCVINFCASILFLVPLHRFCIVSEVLCNIHLCNAFQCFIPLWEGATSSHINSLGSIQVIWQLYLHFCCFSITTWVNAQYFCIHLIAPIYNPTNIGLQFLANGLSLCFSWKVALFSEKCCTFHEKVHCFSVKSATPWKALHFSVESTALFSKLLWVLGLSPSIGLSLYKRKTNQVKVWWLGMFWWSTHVLLCAPIM